MHIYYYDSHPNFGDVLNKYLWHPLFGDFIGRNDNIVMIGVGTLLGHPIKNEGPVIVCGSGGGYGGDFSHIKDYGWKFFFVRGPKSASVIGLPESSAITDPAILTPDVFPAASKHGKTIFVPHWETSISPLWKSACKHAGIEYVDPLSDITEIMKIISGAKLVIAEAMHAAIIADAYRVPWVSVSTSQNINSFKWQDWAESLGMVHSFQHYSPMGFSVPVLNYRTNWATKFEKKAENTFEDHGKKDVPPPGKGLLLARKIYKSITPQSWQAGKYWEVLVTTANMADHSLDLLLKTGLYDRYFDQTVRDLEISASTPGQLSNDTQHDSKKSMLLDRLQDVRHWLAKQPSH